MKDKENSFTVHIIKDLREAVYFHWKKRKMENYIGKVASYTNLVLLCDIMPSEVVF